MVAKIIFIPDFLFEKGLPECSINRVTKEDCKQWSSFNYCPFLRILPYCQVEGKNNLLEIEFFKLIIANCISSKIMERDGTKTNVIAVENKIP